MGVTVAGSLPNFTGNCFGSVSRGKAQISCKFDMVVEGLELSNLTGGPYGNIAAFNGNPDGFAGTYIYCCHVFNCDTAFLQGTMWGSAVMANCLLERNGNSYSQAGDPLEQAYFFPFYQGVVSNVKSIGAAGSHELKLRCRISCLQNFQSSGGNEAYDLFAPDMPTGGELVVADTITAQHGPNFNGNSAQIEALEEANQNYFATEISFGTLNTKNDCCTTNLPNYLSVLNNGQLFNGSWPSVKWNIGTIICANSISVDGPVQIATRFIPSAFAGFIPTSGPGTAGINIATTNITPVSTAAAWEDYSPPPLAGGQGQSEIGSGLRMAARPNDLIRLGLCHRATLTTTFRHISGTGQHSGCQRWRVLW